MKKIFIFSTMLLISIFSLKAQDQIVFDDNMPESELHAAINPTDNMNMIVAAINDFSEIGSSLSIYYTLDFGSTWQQSVFHGVPPNYESAGDPVLKFDNNGVVYLANLAAGVSGGQPQVHTVMSYSTDKGITWQSIITNNSSLFTDKPWIAIDRNPASPHNGKKYVVTVVGDSGNVILTIVDNNNAIVSNSIDVFANVTGIKQPNVECKSNGDVFISAYSENLSSIIIAKSTDGGLTFGSHSVVTPVFLEAFSITGSNDYIIGIPDRLFCSNAIAIDNSGGINDGRIYITLTDYESGSSGGGATMLDTYIMWSDNDGITWTTPTVLHPNAPANTQQYYSNIYVNNQGKVLVAWYDRRDDPNHKNTDYYLGISSDGGNTFTEIKLTTATTDFSLIGSLNNNFGIGEYCQLVATNDFVIPFWADGRTNNGDINIYFAKIDINNPLSVHEVSTISDKIKITVYPNPFVDDTKISITLKEEAKLIWGIFDVNGRKVEESNFQNYSIGEKQIDIPLKTLNSGIYFIRFLSDSNFIKTVKIIKK